MCMICLLIYRCAIPGYDNDTFEVQNEAHQQLINTTIPVSEDEPGKYDQCHTMDANSLQYGDTIFNSKITKCSSWVYDTSSYTKTIGIEVIKLYKRKRIHCIIKAQYVN